MATIEHPQLHLFERHHVGDQFRSRFLPLRTSGNKVILNHPLTERFAGHPGRVAHPGQLGNFIEGFGSHRRDNPVHHRRRKGDILLYPCRKILISPGVGADDVAHHVTIFRHVIAGHHGKSRQAGRPAAR